MLYVGTATCADALIFETTFLFATGLSGDGFTSYQRTKMIWMQAMQAAERVAQRKQCDGVHAPGGTNSAYARDPKHNTKKRGDFGGKKQR